MRPLHLWWMSPRGLAWRTAARSAAVLLLAAVWTAAVLHAGDGSLFGHRNAVWLQGIGATAAGGGLGCWRRARGEAMPGLVVATAVMPAATAWALVRPLKDQLAVFPYGTTSPRGVGDQLHLVSRDRSRGCSCPGRRSGRGVVAADNDDTVVMSHPPL